MTEQNVYIKYLYVFFDDHGNFVDCRIESGRKLISDNRLWLNCRIYKLTITQYKVNISYEGKLISPRYEFIEEGETHDRTNNNNPDD